MTGKIFGLPLIVIILAAIIVIPNLVSDVFTRKEISELNQRMVEMNAMNQMPPVQVAPTVEVTPTESPTPTKAVRTVKPSTQSGQLQ